MVSVNTSFILMRIITIKEKKVDGKNENNNLSAASWHGRNKGQVC